MNNMINLVHQKRKLRNVLDVKYKKAPKRKR